VPRRVIPELPLKERGHLVFLAHDGTIRCGLPRIIGSPWEPGGPPVPLGLAPALAEFNPLFSLRASVHFLDFRFLNRSTQRKRRGLADPVCALCGALANMWAGRPRSLTHGRATRAPLVGARAEFNPLFSLLAPVQFLDFRFLNRSTRRKRRGLADPVCALWGALATMWAGRPRSLTHGPPVPLLTADRNSSLRQSSGWPSPESPARLPSPP